MTTLSAVTGSPRWTASITKPDAGNRAITVRSGLFRQKDIDLALDAAHKVKDKWAQTSVQDRAAILFKIADRMEQNLELLATAETWDNGKPIRETSAADVPLAIDHFRYFASCIRAQEGGISEVDSETVAYHFHEPLGVVGQIIRGTSRC
jgi:aldehyde dehydrogenase